MEEWLTTYEAATVAEYDPDYLRKMVRAGKIKARKWGLSWQINSESLMAFKKESEEKGGKRGPKRLTQATEGI
jgi:excisionase family DNA binding protein